MLLKKAFVMNRIGDLGFFLEMFMALFNFACLDFEYECRKSFGVRPNSMLWHAASICSCFFCRSYR